MVVRKQCKKKKAKKHRSLVNRKDVLFLQDNEKMHITRVTGNMMIDNAIHIPLNTERNFLECSPGLEMDSRKYM